MVSIAAKNLLHDRTRVALSAGGVGFAIMLVLILAATFDGFDRQVGLQLENSGADLYVGQAGIVDSFHSFSILPLNLSEDLATVPGVDRVCAIIQRTVEVHLPDDTHARVVVVGYHETHNTAAPWMVQEGARLPGENEIVVDEVLARKNGISVGSEIRIGDRPFRVAGISEETNLFISQYVFVRFQDLQGLVLPPGTATFFLVEINPGADIRTVQAEIETRYAGVDAYTVDEFVENNREYIGQAFLPILLVLYVIGFVIGILVIGLTVYTATMERAREYGILKAIGAGTGRLVRIVLGQALLLSVFGFVLGLAITAGVAYVIGLAVPEMPLYFQPAVLPQVFAAALGMSAIATLLPTGRLARIDPATIFRRG
jgi:putative ABC transport system permease protein